MDGCMNVLPIRAKVSIFHFKYNFCAHIMLMDVFANLKHTIGLNHHLTLQCERLCILLTHDDTLFINKKVSESVVIR